MLGYEENKKAYHLLDAETREFISSRHVHFNENIEISEVYFPNDQVPSNMGLSFDDILQHNQSHAPAMAKEPVLPPALALPNPPEDAMDDIQDMSVPLGSVGVKSEVKEDTPKPLGEKPKSHIPHLKQQPVVMQPAPVPAPAPAPAPPVIPRLPTLAPAHQIAGVHTRTATHIPDTPPATRPGHDKTYCKPKPIEVPLPMPVENTEGSSTTSDTASFVNLDELFCRMAGQGESAIPLPKSTPDALAREDEPIPGLTSGELTDPPPPSSVDPQQSAKVFAQEHLSDPSTRAHSPQTVPARIHSPIGTASVASTSAPSPHLSRVAKALGTATQGRDSPRGIISSSDSRHNLSGAPDESDHAPPDEGGTENEDGSFTIKAMEAMEATEWLNTVFNQIRTSMNRMSLTMKDIFLVPKQKSSEKTIEPRNNRTCDKAAAKAATERIVTQGATNIPVTGT
ncbi:hypothetical protein M422DRAFT_252868 [Sphaerobolus stellatus SS14]|uniref:Retroviral polymerase SH3-like domain-containing protein n=1 Tax=Sphaerobolus stellatus (strain SS14) TaxID=990650 RepID=A0A0C9VZI1_SPHS4|nr:hypothetical protein M422DRAFT_252868 [Sphaerobolus stellatus SS14]